MAALRIRREQQERDEQAAGRSGSAPAWSSPQWRAVQWTRVTSAGLGTACETAGLGPVRFHDLRHSCASFLIAAGASPRTVMKTLGHSQISLTMNTYAHVLPEVERAAVDAAAQVIYAAQPDACEA
jgi:integrase